jgi:ribosomal protein L11 methyltransferase
LKEYPALDVQSGSSGLLLAIVDDFGPTAAEEHDASVRIFFQTSSDRDAAHRALAERFAVTAIEVSDEDWARRSQENLTPITVGRITIFPSPQSPVPSPQVPSPQSLAPNPQPLIPNPQPLIPNPYSIVILPSMGFGTGHHATTRLCLAALQTIDLRAQVVLDIGTGSGVLAMAAERLGAARATGIDHDADAIQSARENLQLNRDIRSVSFDLADLAAARLPETDVVTANLTGALLVRSSSAVLAAVRPGGTLILSGLLSHERDEVCAAFAPAAVVWEREEDGWVGLAMKKP